MAVLPRKGGVLQRLTRRSVLLGFGGFALALAFGEDPVALAAPVRRPRMRPNAWITIDADDWVTLISPASEMGQGVMTSIPLLLAEEMDADWRKVRVHQAPSDAKAFGNPAFGGIQATGGSRTTRAYSEVMRLAGAQARSILVSCAGRLLGVTPHEITVGLHVLIHAPTGRRLSFGEVAATAVLPDPLPSVSAVDLKPPARWRYIGKDVPRIDIPGKVRGEPAFGIDVQPEGLLFGAVARPAVQGEMPLHVDDSAARAMSGVVMVVPLPYGVGVIATSTWKAWQARDALRIIWSSLSPARFYDSALVMEAYAAIAASTDGEVKRVARRGDVGAALNSAARIIETTYLSEHVHQATMEPPTATALVGDGEARVWGSFQAQTAVQTTAATVLGIAAAKVAVEIQWLGGGLGRKYEVDFALDAILLARAVKGRPVKITWTREDDVRHGKYRPLQAQHIRVGLDTHGRIVGWRHRLVCSSILARYAPQDFATSGGVDPAVTEGMTPSYAIPALLAEWRPAAGIVDVGFYRAIAPGYTKFAVEGTLDEAAAALGIDPLKFRLDLLTHAPRAQNVLRVAARMSEWGRRRPDAALGVAYSDAFGSHCAQVAEIALDRVTGEIRVRNIWCAIDCGLAIQPDNIKAQIMGGAIHGVSQALHEQVRFAAGAVREGNFNDYRILRFNEAPAIQVAVVGSPDDAPGGIGEAGLPPVGPAIANAVAALTGVRLRRYPFAGDRVNEALRSSRSE
jgi:isoquinoline 1-oxidoreductase beta subunit